MIPTLLELPIPFLGALPIRSFGLMMVLAFLAAWQRLYLSLKASGEDPALAERMVTWAAVGGIVGARLGYVASYPSEFMAAPLEVLFSGAGFVFYGGFIGGAGAVWLLLRLEKKPFLPMADITAPALAIGYAVGRIGCQLSGDGDYGIVSSLPWAMEYSLGVVPTPPGELRHPAPVYESLLAFCIAAVLLAEPVRRRLRGTGQLFGLYLLLAAAERYWVEIIRIEPRLINGLSQAQLVSLALGVIALLLLYFRRPPAQTRAA